MQTVKCLTYFQKLNTSTDSAYSEIIKKTDHGTDDWFCCPDLQQKNKIFICVALDMQYIVCEMWKWT